MDVSAMSSNVYEAVERFMNALEEADFTSEASQLRDCLRSGSTGTEILMCLNCSLGTFLQSASLPRNLHGVAAELRREVRKIGRL